MFKKYISQQKKRQEIQSNLGVIKKKEHQKISKLLNNSDISNFSTRKLIEVKDLKGNHYSVNKNKQTNKQTKKTVKNFKSKIRYV